MDDVKVAMTPPHDLNAEIAVLGSMLMDSECIPNVSELICKEDFYSPPYAAVFEVLTDMYKSRIQIDPVTLVDKLKERDIPPEYRNTDFITSLYNSVPMSSNAQNYASIVFEKAQARRLIQASQHIIKTCYAGHMPLEDMLDESEKKIFEITQKRVGSNFDNISDIMLRTVDSIEAAYKSEGKITGIPTGFVDLDTKLQGFHKSDFILVAARPAMGKTAFVLNIAEHMVLREKKNVALFSLEMSCEQLAKRLIAMQANVDAQKIGKGDLSADDWKKVIDGVNSLGASNLFVCDKSGITLSEIRSKCRKLQIERGLDMVIIDYLQLMESDRRRASDNRQNEISAISRGLKVMARELDIPVVTLSQLSRAVESRTDKRPMLSDLRESGAIEQDADIVMFIYRDEYYNKENSKDPGVAEVIVAKHRNGPVGTEKLAWVGKYTKFSNLDKSYYARKES